MSLWSYPATVLEVTGAASFAAELDLGCRWYHPTVIRVAGIRPRNTGRLRELLAPGTRVAAVTEHLTGGNNPVRAHVTLDDGRDLAAAIRGRDIHADHHADYGGTWAKVWRYPATVLHVVDGDTVAAKLDLGVPTRHVNSVRIEHVDAPEKHTTAGDAATEFAVATIPTNTQVLITSHQLERYGRILGTLTLPDGRGDYGTELLAAGHAVPYEC